MISRPDGHPYRPRRPGLRARPWEGDDSNGCIIFGTLDPDAARAHARDACDHWYGDGDTFQVLYPTPGWWRDGYNLHGRAWIEDDKRGAPGVMFTWDPVPPPVQDARGLAAGERSEE